MNPDTLLQIIRNEVKRAQGGSDRKPPPAAFALGTIDPAYTADAGRPKVVVDGDTVPAGPYPYLSSYTPAANDRVLMARVGVAGKFVILGSIV
ncbi:hypothetical protein [Alicyclobacillus shizuokensis]|uniref:hypothetical protein n=1 Tax=Alicyclobacillus shizuokensis TaxID=392014 RepID=UPI00082F1055|nr:hypothetical protein [Alicyclobacillus shizuokensis]